MAAEEVIHVTIIDPSVDDVLFKLNRARDLSRTMRQYTLFGEPLSSGKLLDLIPSVSRAQRLIITQIPLMREALMLAYRGRMISQAGVAVGGTVAAIYLIQLILKMQQQIDRQDEQFETFVREGLGLTHKEFEEWRRTDEAQRQVGFATLWDQYFVEREGTLRQLWTAWMAEWIATVGPFIPGDVDTGVPDWVQGGMEDESWTSWGRDQLNDPG